MSQQWNQRGNLKIPWDKWQSTTLQDLWDAAKVVLRGKFIVIQAFLKKQEKSQINLTYHLKELEKEEQTKPKISRRKEIIKIREEINKIEIKNNRKKLIKPRAGFSERVNKIDKPLARLTKKKREDPNKQNKKWKRRNNSRYCRNKKNHKRILWTSICQQTGQPRRNGQVSKNIQPTKT